MFRWFHVGFWVLDVLALLFLGCAGGFLGRWVDPVRISGLRVLGCMVGLGPIARLGL